MISLWVAIGVQQSDLSAKWNRDDPDRLSPVKVTQLRCSSPVPRLWLLGSILNWLLQMRNNSGIVLRSRRFYYASN